MKTKKILIISDVPSHPKSAGNRTRICDFLFNLKKLGCEIHFVYENKELVRTEHHKPDIKAMKKAWDKVYTVPLNKYVLYCFIDKGIGKIGILLRKIWPKMYWLLKKIKEKFKIEKAPNIDDLYSPPLDKVIRKISKRERFDIVLAEYIYQSKALDYFDDSVLKIIDTHDVLTSENAIEANKRFRDFTIYSKKEESKAFNRADIVIAIQDEEKKYFKQITDKKVVTIGHVIGLHKPIKSISKRKNILFVGFINHSNKYGMRFFIKKVFPKVKAKLPDAKLIVAGKICKFIPNEEGVVKLGFVNDIEKVYAIGDIVICPLFFGTGLKIKAVEALGYCKPLVITSFGAKGIEKGKNKAFLVADTAEEFAEAIEKIFSDKKLYKNLSKNAHKFMKEYNQKNIETLKSVF